MLLVVLSSGTKVAAIDTSAAIVSPIDFVGLVVYIRSVWPRGTAAFLLQSLLTGYKTRRKA
jgi:hypothetical protein